MVVECLRCALGVASCGLLVISLHELGKLVGEVGCWGVFYVLGVELFVPCWRYERRRSRCSRWEVHSYAVGALLVPNSVCMGGVIM